MNIVQIDNWYEYQRDGEQFLQTALGAYRKKKETFTSDTLYNLTCMAIEKLIMAFLMKNGDLADNHTMGDLLRSLQRHLDLQPELVDKMVFLDSFQEICDLENYQVRIPAEDDILTILATGEKLHQQLRPYLEA